MSDEIREQEDQDRPVIREKRVDEGWKAQVAKERAKEDAESSESADAETSEKKDIKPHPLWPNFLSSLAHQALIFLGQEADPMSGQSMLDLQQARFSIDLLLMIREKTQGNLAYDERKMIDQLVSELQMIFVEVSKQVAAQQASGPGQPPEGGTAPFTSPQ